MMVEYHMRANFGKRVESISHEPVECSHRIYNRLGAILRRDAQHLGPPVGGMPKPPWYLYLNPYRWPTPVQLIGEVSAQKGS